MVCDFSFKHIDTSPSIFPFFATTTTLDFPWHISASGVCGISLWDEMDIRSMARLC